MTCVNGYGKVCLFYRDGNIIDSWQKGNRVDVRILTTVQKIVSLWSSVARFGDGTHTSITRSMPSGAACSNTPSNRSEAIRIHDPSGSFLSKAWRLLVRSDFANIHRLVDLAANRCDEENALGGTT